MKINKNLLAGLGIGLLAYYIYTLSNNKAAAPSEEKKEGNAILPNSGKIDSPITMPSTEIKPSTSNSGVVNPLTLRRTQQERECIFQYISMPKPKAVMSAEYWKSHQEKFIKECIERKNRVR